MKAPYPGINNIIKAIGLKDKEKMLILVDQLSDKRAIKVLEKGFCQNCSKVKVGQLPLILKDDFPSKIRKIVKSFDVIFLAASQSWYQAPTRKMAKYQYRKRVVECYGLTLEMLKKGALCVDSKELTSLTEDYKEKFKPGKIINIKTKKGTDFSAEIRSVLPETGCYSRPASGGNLPAGEISLGVVKETANGWIVFDVCFDILGRLERNPLRVFIDKGRVVEVEGRYKKTMESLFKKDSRLRNIAEIGIGTNPYAILGRSVLEDEKKLGTVHIGLGNDTYFGGKVDGPHLDGVFLKLMITFGR